MNSHTSRQQQEGTASAGSDSTPGPWGSDRDMQDHPTPVLCIRTGGNPKKSSYKECAGREQQLKNQLQY